MSRFAGAKDFYEALGVERTATEIEIKRAFRRLALQVHPDKNPGNEQATHDFQELTRMASVLTDPKRRKVYDLTGEADDEDAPSSSYDEAYAYWRARYAAITKQDIENYAKAYRGSEDETEDLVLFYNQFDGDMGRVLENVPLSRGEDVPRFVAKLDELIKAGTVKRLKRFAKTRNLKLDDQAEAAEAAEHARALGLDGSDESLANAIMKRGQARAGILDVLAARYGGDAKARRTKGGKGGADEGTLQTTGKKRTARAAAAAPEIDDDEFRRIQQEMLDRKAASSSAAPAAAAGASKKRKSTK